MSHMIEGAQAILLSSKEVDRFEHICRVRDSMPFNRFGKESAGVVHAVRLLVVERGYLARGLTEGRSLGAPQPQIEGILEFDCRKDARNIE